MQFKKKRKKRKLDEMDEDLVKEQERLFNDAQNLLIQEQKSVSLPESIDPPPIRLPSLEKALSAPILLNERSQGVLLELEKKLSEKHTDMTDFDALRANP